MSAATDWEELRTWVRTAAGFSVTPTQLARLKKYIDLLRFWNRKIALVSQGDIGRLITRHVADSLFAAAHCTDGEAIVDLGSGAGFPGIPIAIVRPKSRVLLIESRAKKASFLEEAVRVAGASNAAVGHGRIEEEAIKREHKGQYDVAIFRAVASTDELRSASRKLLKPSGRAIAMKSSKQELSAARGVDSVVPYRLPDGAERLLLILPVHPG